MRPVGLWGCNTEMQCNCWVANVLLSALTTLLLLLSFFLSLRVCVCGYARGRRREHVPPYATMLSLVSAFLSLLCLAHATLIVNVETHGNSFCASCSLPCRHRRRRRRRRRRCSLSPSSHAFHFQGRFKDFLIPNQRGKDEIASTGS